MTYGNYAVSVFARVLSGLAMQGSVGSEKRKRMTAAFLAAKGRDDADACKELLEELLFHTENAVWKKDLQSVLEMLSADC